MHRNIDHDEVGSPMQAAGVSTPVEAGFVGCEVSTSSGRVEVRNPARIDEVVGTYPSMVPGMVDGVVRRAADAQPAWARLHPQERFDRIVAAVQGVEVDGLAELLTREHGKILSESQRELQYMSFPVNLLGAHVPWLADGEDLGDSGRHHSRVYRDPYGVVGVVAPWNFPISTAMITVAPALLAGNAVVMHVPATAALTALEIYGQIAAALPPGLLALFTSPSTDVAQALVEHPLVRHVHFTGSTRVGSLVAHEAADSLATTTLELGGNDAAIVLDDALEDPSIYARLVRSAFASEGQACVALKRLYVPRRRVDEVFEGLGAVLESTVVGDGLDPATTVGPMHTAAGLANVQRLVEAARAAGGRVGEYGSFAVDPAQGYFMRPVLASGIGADNPLVREEQFGLALPIIAYDGVDDAIAQANDCVYGLGSSVWSPDVERAMAIARRLEAGMTWINAHAGAGVDGRVPWGGVKHSGVGRGGANRAGLEIFTEPHAVVVPTA
ncbi:aldehyde dehydrogenase family protein [Georgenia sp. AZ-5]|uniref:aldehyde dehydrogenase family protein n=1 Tax=Georgenia sp. AZ-5 TaxID=3367526 RepID=UPI003754EEFC